MFRITAMFAFLIVVQVFSAISSRAADSYQISQIKDNIYRFSTGHYHSVFMVTEAGILVTDPINPAAAKYLKSTLAERFEVPIKFMVYSHNHVDHTSGGDVIANEGVQVIAHEYAAQDLAWTRASTALPDVTFKDALTIDLGNSQVQLRYHGPNNGRGSISMRFMPANVVHVVDWIVLGRMPYQDLPGYDIHGMIHSTREILAAEDFDVFVGGHAETGTRADVVAYLGYLEALYEAVRDGMLAGKSLERLQAEISLPDYQHLTMYDEWLPLNIAGVYRMFNDMSYFNMRELPTEPKK